MIVTQTKTPATVADVLALVDRLGGIDPARIRMQPPPGTATEVDVLNIVEHKLGRCELVERTLVEKAPMGMEDNWLAATLISFLVAFVRPRRLGAVFSSQGPVRMTGGNVRLPDVGFFTAAQWRAWRRRRPAVAAVAPALAVEILSKSNTRAEMSRKRREYFASGSILVWEVNPRRRSVTVFTSPTEYCILTETDSLDGGNVLPGFRLPLADLFVDPLVS